MTRTDNVERHLPLHPEAFRILVVLRGQELHGYAIVKELERDPGRPGRVLPANLYRRIRTLSEQGLIAETRRPRRRGRRAPPLLPADPCWARPWPGPRLCGSRSSWPEPRDLLA